MINNKALPITINKLTIIHPYIKPLPIENKSKKAFFKVSNSLFTVISLIKVLVFVIFYYKHLLKISSGNPSISQIFSDENPCLIKIFLLTFVLITNRFKYLFYKSHFQE